MSEVHLFNCTSSVFITVIDLITQILLIGDLLPGPYSCWFFGEEIGYIDLASRSALHGWPGSSRVHLPT